MYKIVKKEELGQDTFLMEVEAPKIAQAVLPGQFVIVKADETAERIPLTVSDTYLPDGTITLVIKAIGISTRKIVSFPVGGFFHDVVGPLGNPSAFIHRPIGMLRRSRYCFIAGGVGIAPVFPLVKWMSQHGLECDVIIGARNASLLFYIEQFRKITNNLYIATDDGSMGFKGNVNDMLMHLV